MPAAKARCNIIAFDAAIEAGAAQVAVDQSVPPISSTWRPGIDAEEARHAGKFVSVEQDERADIGRTGGVSESMLASKPSGPKLLA